MYKTYAENIKDAMHNANADHDPTTVTRLVDKAELQAKRIETHYRFADSSALVCVFGHGIRGLRLIGWGLEKPENRRLVSATSRSMLRRLFLQQSMRRVQN